MWQTKNDKNENNKEFFAFICKNVLKIIANLEKQWK